MASARHKLGNISLLLALLTLAGFTTATHETLPHACDSVQCPPLSTISCPPDSDVRETFSMPLGSLDAVTAAPLKESYNTTEIDDELYTQCCLTKRCMCRTCYIPDCHNDHEVVIELLPESMETPGHCCGQYKCHKEPNCTEVRDTELYWLTDCQRCKCYSGERICHQSCDDDMKKPTAICNSKNLNTFFEHGDSWKDGCYECECVHGENKCVMPFCRSLNCPLHRQVMLKDSCCRICWPKGIPMPNGDKDYGDEQDIDKDKPDEQSNRIYDDENDDEPLVPQPFPSNEYSETEVDPLPDIQFSNEVNASASEPAIPTATTKYSTTGVAITTDAMLNSEWAIVSSTEAASGPDNAPTANSPPCTANNGQQLPATYQVYPEVVEVVRQTHQNDVLYAIIGCLVVIIIILLACNIHLRTMKRSYRPVSNFDDSFNKTSNIKKINV